VADSGTYAYTRDLAARYAFRATAAHNAVQLGEEEQNPISVERPWRILEDRARAHCTEWTVDHRRVSFAGRHSGFAARPSGAVCSRRISFEAEAASWEIADLVEGLGRESLTWRLHFAPGTVKVESEAPGRASLTHEAAPEYRFELSAPDSLGFALEESPWSERYGVRVQRPMAVLRGPAELPARIQLRIRRLGRTA